jgi:hypothetical protein
MGDPTTCYDSNMETSISNCDINSLSYKCPTGKCAGNVKPGGCTGTLSCDNGKWVCTEQSSFMFYIIIFIMILVSAIVIYVMRSRIR